MLWGSLFILKAVAGTSSSSCSRAVLWTPRCYRILPSLISQSPLPVLCFLCVPFMEGWTHRHSPRWAAFMERSAEPYFNVWAYVALCPFLDLNVYPWHPSGGEIFPDAKVMRAWTDKYRVAMAAQKIRQLSFFFFVPHKKEVFQIFCLELFALCSLPLAFFSHRKKSSPGGHHLKFHIQIL